MATDSYIHIYIQLIHYQPNFANKGLKMTKSSNASQCFRITAKALKLSGIIIRFMYFSEK